MEYRIKRTDSNSLSHAGKKGMKWGYNDGVKNGKRTAEDEKKPWENDTPLFDALMDSPIHGLGARMIEDAAKRGVEYYKKHKHMIIPISAVGVRIMK